METGTPKLNKALIEARKEMRNPAFDSVNPHFKSKFASLKSVVDATIPVLAEHGIAVMQDLQTDDQGQIMVYTILAHESGEERTLGPLRLRPRKTDPQGAGDAATYGRRYHLMAVAGVVGEEDTDGNRASESSFKSDKEKAETIKSIRDKVMTNDGPNACAEWGRLNNDQKAEAWHDLSAETRKDLKRLLEDNNAGD